MLLVFYRQRYDKLAAPAWCAFDSNVAAMGLNDVPDKRKSQTTSLGVVYQRISCAVELLENFRLLAYRNSDAVVDNFERLQTSPQSSCRCCSCRNGSSPGQLAMPLNSGTDMSIHSLMADHNNILDSTAFSRQRF